MHENHSTPSEFSRPEDRNSAITPGWNGPYNRESGRKTLILIGIIITLVTVLSILSLLMINRKSSVLAQTTYPTSSNHRPK